MPQKPIPKITLVGAGPGDPELLTIKGANAIRSADVVLYDALAGPVLPGLARPEALLIYVGKRAGKHHLRQEEINRLMVHYARSHGHVVRLKGGDPFVFGRGHEEVAYARERGVEVEIIPGISSCIAVPELQQVPVSRRGYSESFWVMTGTTRSGALSEDIALAAQSTATVIILMGMRKARAIAELFEQHGKGQLPAMAIQDGSLPNERRVLGTVKEIADKIEAEGLGTPGILVFGEVAALHPDWDFAQIAAGQRA